MIKEDMPYKKQIFVCTNDMEGEKASCADHCGQEIFRALRNLAKERGLHPRIRVAQATCLGQCGRGGNIMVYPDNVWYHGVQKSDIDAIAEKYLT